MLRYDRTRKLIFLGALAFGGALYGVKSSRAEELFAGQSDGSSPSQAVRVGSGMVGSALSIGAGPAGLTNIDGVLPTMDGTDVIVLGHSSGSQLAWRFGRGASASTLEGDYLSGPDGVTDGPVTLSTTSTAPPQAAWVGDEARHVALLLGDNVVSFREPFQFAADTPAGWTGTSVTLSPGYSASAIAAAGPRQLFIGSNFSSVVKRVLVGMGGAVQQQDCTLQITGSGGTPVFVQALVGLRPAAMASRAGAIAQVVDSANNGYLVALDMDCSGTVPISSSSVAPFSGIALAPGVSTPQLFASAPGTGGPTALLEAFRADSLAPTPGGMLNSLNAGGVVAVTSDGAHLVVGGSVPGSSTQPFGFALNGSGNGSFTPGSGIPGALSAAAAVPSPRFGVQARVFDLNGAGSTRVVYKELYVPPGTPPGYAFKIYSASSCAATTVSLGVVTANGIGGVQSVLTAGTHSGSFPYPNLMAGDTAILAMAQEGATGEDCSFLLTSDTTGGTYNRGGGALLRVKGSTLGQRAMALVFDKSGSMASRIVPSGPADATNPVRFDALRTAALGLANMVQFIPDAQSTMFGVVPFDQMPSAPMMSIAGGDLYTQLTNIFMSGAINPAGSTNIRGAMKTASDWLAGLAGNPLKSIFLLTDGQHNTVGTSATNIAPFVVDDVNCLEPVSPSSMVCPSAPNPSSGYITGTGGVHNLYAIGLSELSTHQSLVRLVGDVNTGGTAAPGYLNYVTSDANQMSVFFHKVLWNYLGASELVDPIVSIPSDKPYQVPVSIRVGMRSLMVSVVWQDPAHIIAVQLLNAATMRPVFAENCHRNGTAVACYVDLSKGFNEDILVSVIQPVGASPPPAIPAMVEVATQAQVVLQSSFGQNIYHSGQKLAARVSLTELGLPIRGATVTGTLIRPGGGLGTALAQAVIDPATIRGFQAKNPDFAAAAAKLALLTGAQLPGKITDNTVVFKDDGQSGDGLAGDGVYGALIDAPIPGIYQVVVQAGYNAKVSGVGTRAGAISTHVVVGLDGGRTVQKIVSFTPPTKAAPGSLVVQLTPQDSTGNLLGPGNAGDVVFWQGGKPLPAKITEPDTLDGTYTAEVSSIAPGLPVVLGSTGGSFVLPVDTSLPGNPTNGGGSGCGCDTLGGAGGPGATGTLFVVMMLLLGALWLRSACYTRPS